MRALVTGGSGFVGSHLAEHLLSQGHDVTVLDDLSTGRRDNIRRLEKSDRFELVVESVLNADALQAAVDQADVIYHLASAVGVRLILEQPVKTIETIVQGTDYVLRAASQNKTPVLITSSSEVYGRGSRVPFDEEQDVVLGPTSKRRWLYACAKMMDEFLALAHWHESKLPVVCVRLFNTVGPRQIGQYGMVLPRFVQQALKGEPLTVHGDGQQSRCFCHVNDAVSTMPKLMANTAAYGRVVNVGSDEEITIENLAKRVVELSGSSSSIKFIPYEEAFEEGFEDLRRRVPDLETARTLIGYEPRYSLDDIIREVIQYWQRD